MLSYAHSKRVDGIPEGMRGIRNHGRGGEGRGEVKKRVV